MRNLSASEAIYGFCAWLTTRDEETVMGASSDAAPAAQRIAEFCKKNNLPDPRDGWEKALIMPPTDG
jgi:hypothetical protein